MGLLGILVGLGLLVCLAFRGWSVLLLAPLCGLVAAAFGGQPLLASWTQTFMTSAAEFLAQFFPIFLLGAVFGKLMDDSGSARAIAHGIVEKLGAERSILAVVLAIGGILAYVSFRFEWQFGVAAVAALTHDVIATIGLFALTQMEFSLSTVAAVLTVAGYSINDTVVVFDRLRENLIKFKTMPLIDVMNLTVNETLSRTIMTADISSRSSRDNLRSGIGVSQMSASSPIWWLA